MKKVMVLDCQKMIRLVVDIGEGRDTEKEEGTGLLTSAQGKYLQESYSNHVKRKPSTTRTCMPEESLYTGANVELSNLIDEDSESTFNLNPDGQLKVDNGSNLVKQYSKN